MLRNLCRRTMCPSTPMNRQIPRLKTRIRMRPWFASIVRRSTFNRIPKRWGSEVPLKLEDPFLREGLNDLVRYARMFEPTTYVRSRRVYLFCALEETPGLLNPYDWHGSLVVDRLPRSHR